MFVFQGYGRRSIRDSSNHPSRYRGAHKAVEFNADTNTFKYDHLRVEYGHE